MPCLPWVRAQRINRMTYDESITGTCFNIQHYSIHDGSGIRTTVFVKGCPLRCSWCSNPESQNFHIELAFNPEKCIDCKTCVQHSRSGVVSIGAMGEICFHPDRQTPEDLQLADICPGQALFCYGKRCDVDEVMRNVLRESLFYAYSSGGITVSGGEPLAQPQFTRALLKAAKSHRLSTAIESCGLYALDDKMDIFGLLDELYMDIKLLDANAHSCATGAGNEKILSTIRAVRKTYPALRMIIRTPVIPGVNDSVKVITEIARFVRDELPGTTYEPLRFHRFGEPKYRYLGRRYLYAESSLKDECFNEIAAAAQAVFSGR